MVSTIRSQRLKPPATLSRHSVTVGQNLDLCKPSWITLEDQTHPVTVPYASATVASSASSACNWVLVMPASG